MEEAKRKPASESGLLFIANGEMVRVDTAGKKYLGKETSGDRPDGLRTATLTSP
jgi:hypothetical protein